GGLLSPAVKGSASCHTTGQGRAKPQNSANEAARCADGMRRRGKLGVGEPSPKKEPWERNRWTAPQGLHLNRAARNCAHPGLRWDLNRATLNHPRHQVTPPFRQPRWRTPKPGGVSIPNLLTQLPPQPGGTTFSPPISSIRHPTSTVKLPLEAGYPSPLCTC